MLLLLGITLVAAGIFGLLLALLSDGTAGAVPSLTLAPYWTFASFGGSAAAVHTSADDALGFGSSMIPILLLALPACATWLSLRFASTRFTRGPANESAFVAKLALVTGVLCAILASVLTFKPAGESTGFRSSVSATGGFFGPLLVIGLVGLAFLWKRHTAFPWQPWQPGTGLRDSARTATQGILAFGVLATGFAAIALVAGLIAADGTTDRLVLLGAFLAVGANVGVNGAVVAMGASLGVTTGGTASPIVGGGAVAGPHLSLLHWGFPPTTAAGAAPPYLFILLAAAPVAVGWMTWRRLERDQPRSEQDSLRIGFLVALGFTLTAWLAAVLGRIEIAGIASHATRRAAGIIVKPSLPGTFGLALLWGLVGALLPALAWSRQRSLAWGGGVGRSPGAAPFQTSAPSSTPAPTPTPAPPVPAPSDETSFAPPLPRAGEEPTPSCPGCGRAAVAGARFCPGCGTRLE